MFNGQLWDDDADEDVWPQYVGKGRAPSPKFDYIRDKCAELKTNGKIKRIHGFQDRKSAQNAGGVALNWGTKNGKGRGWVIRTATIQKEDGSWVLLIKKIG